jgi:hypothetical protein
VSFGGELGWWGENTLFVLKGFDVAVGGWHGAVGITPRV